MKKEKTQSRRRDERTVLIFVTRKLRELYPLYFIAQARPTLIVKVLLHEDIPGDILFHDTAMDLITFLRGSNSGGSSSSSGTASDSTPDHREKNEKGE